MKKIIAIILVICTLGLVSCTRSRHEIDEEKTATLGTGSCVYATTRDTKTYKRNVGYVEMCIENFGRVVFLLDATTAPKTVVNFIGLVKGGYYDKPTSSEDTSYHGNTFHIVEKDRLLQGGCPNHDGTGTLENKIFGEFPDNGWANDISHKKGVISMVRENDPDSAACQFFICMKDMLGLDSQYASFGYVIEGMSVLEEVMEYYSEYADAENASIIFDVENQPVIRYIKWIPDKDGYWASRHS